MKRIFSLFVLTSMLVLPLAAQQQLTAFPGAEGYGKFTTGGRGGEVCYVTSLADCTDDNLVEGTLRWAIRHDNGGVPRTILFKVSGTILTTSDLKFAYPNVSILGQTAPNGGICIAGYKFYVCQSNVIIRYIRFRAGDLAGWKSGKSCPSIDVENVKNVIIDHCSITWSMEECLTMYDNDSTTVQHCILGEALYNSMNAKGARAYATQWGGQWSTMHHCLLTNSNNRIPRFNGVRDASTWWEPTQKWTHDRKVDSEFANNVIFNWGKNNSAYGGEDDKTINNDSLGNHDAYDHIYMINNYWRPGPTTKKNVTSTRYFVQGDPSNANGYGQWYLSGNKFELNSQYVDNSKACWKDTMLQHVNNDNLYGFASNNSNRAFQLKNLTPSQEAYDAYVLTSLPEGGLSGLEYDDADAAYQTVTTKAGASLPCYDPVDTRLLAEAAGKQAPKYFGPSTAGGTTPARGIGIIDTPNNIDRAEYNGKYIRLTIDGVDTCNIYPDLAQLGTPYTVADDDNDGMPNTYETLNNLNPNDSSDGVTLGDSGYTHLEEYLNGVASGKLNRDGSAASTPVDELVQTPARSTQAFDILGRPVHTFVPGQIYILGGKRYIYR